MDVKKITSIAIVFIVACIGWWILGTATSVRSYKLYCQLDSEVESLWGEPIVQKEPLFSVQIPGSDKIRRVIPTQNIIHADIKSDYRKKGLIWYATYICD